jgi:hypothetical protein
VEHVQQKLGVSERRACRVLKQPRTSQRYEGASSDQEALLTARMVVAHDEGKAIIRLNTRRASLFCFPFCPFPSPGGRLGGGRLQDPFPVDGVVGHAQHLEFGKGIFPGHPVAAPVISGDLTAFVRSQAALR